MKEFTVGKKDAGKRVDRFLMDKMPQHSRGFLAKALRTKKIRLNGKHPKGNEHLEAGDVIVSYIIEKKQEEKKPDTFHFKVIYEDREIIVVNKEAGILSEDSTGKAKNTLENEVNQYLSDKGQKARLCHRLDFNTSGLVILAKTGAALHEMNRLIKERKMEKSYLCVVLGGFDRREGTLVHQLLKDSGKNQVYLSEKPRPGSKTAVTHYRVLDGNGRLSLVECTLETGRTHQIRSQMAYIGHPLLGDDKYGSKTENKKYKERKQLLCAAKIHFAFGKEGGPLDYLSGKTIELTGKDKPEFVKKYFG